MTYLSENDIGEILRAAKTEPVNALHINRKTIAQEVDKRQKRRARKKTIFMVLVPTSLLLVGFGSRYTASQLMNLSVTTGHVNYAVSATQYNKLTSGNPDLKKAYHALEGWLQSQESFNPDTWNTAPFKSYKVLGITPTSPTRITAHIEVLLNNNHWSGRNVPMTKVNQTWVVSIPKYGEPKGSRFSWAF